MSKIGLSEESKLDEVVEKSYHVADGIFSKKPEGGIVKEVSSFRYLLKELLSLFIPVIVAYLLVNCIFAVARVEGNSMNPTLQDGDKVVISKMSKPDRGDIIVFEYGNVNLIKRVIAVPGDTLRIEDSKVYVNGLEIDEAYINENEFDGDVYEGCDIVLDAGEYFVMGDNRNHSSDSRTFGVIDAEDVKGVELFKFKKILGFI